MIRSPANAFVLGDVTMHLAVTGNPIVAQGNFAPPQLNYELQLSSPSEAARLARQYEARRHRGLFNVLFADNHVESRKPARVFSRTATIYRHWNIDNQDHLNLVREPLAMQQP